MNAVNNVNELLSMLFDVFAMLGDEYHEKVVYDEWLRDAIKVTKDGFTSALYISLYPGYPTDHYGKVFYGTMFDEPEGRHVNDVSLVVAETWWDLDDDMVTIDKVVIDIDKFFFQDE